MNDPLRIRVKNSKIPSNVGVNFREGGVNWKIPTKKSPLNSEYVAVFMFFYDRHWPLNVFHATGLFLSPLKTKAVVF